MCRDCGCSLTPAGARHIPAPRDAQTVLRDLLADNDAQARRNRAYFDGQRVSVINLMSSPGAGKTALLEATADACHLDAAMVHTALQRIDLSHVDLLFIENVGNLVCPAAGGRGRRRGGV